MSISGVRLPIAPNAYDGIELYPVAERLGLPKTSGVPLKGRLTLRTTVAGVEYVYHLFPNCIDHKNDPQVVYYAAYSVRNARTAFAVGPRHLDVFDANITLYVAIEGNFFPLVGDHLDEHQLESAVAMAKAMRGDLKGAFGSVLQANLAAFKNPFWVIDTGTAVGGAAVASGGSRALRTSGRAVKSGSPVRAASRPPGPKPVTSQPATPPPAEPPRPAATAAETRARKLKADVEEIRLTEAQYKAALGHVFPGHALDQVTSVVDGIGQAAARRVATDPRFLQAVREKNWKLAGTLYHSAAAAEARSLAPGSLPQGWTLQAEHTIQAGQGGSRADLLLRGPSGQIVEFDWKTTGSSALSSKARQEMQKHAGQIRTHIQGTQTVQESRSWVDYVRPVLPNMNW